MIWEHIKLWAMVLGFASVGLGVFFVLMVLVQAWRENRAYDRANQRLDEYIRRQYPGNDPLP